MRFTPAVPRKAAALRRLAMGPVLKLNLRFRHPFWEEFARGRFRDAAFFLAPDAAFPTFWTALPARAPTLVAWAAGPKAARLAGLSRQELLDPVCRSLERVFGRHEYRTWLEGYAGHDWQADPFARGAYGHLLAGGGEPRKALAAPVLQTLYFAGEACDVSGEAATVAGALNSGRRAAQRILADVTRAGL